MAALFRLALRNVLRHRARTAFVLSALVICSAGFVFYANLIRGFYFSLIDRVVAAQAGDVVLRNPAWVDEARPRNSLDATPALVERLRSLPGVAAVVPRLEAAAYLNTTEGGRPVQAVGVRPEVEKEVSSLAQKVGQGRYLRGEDRHAAVIGAALASSLDLEIGARMVLMASDRGGEVRSRMVRVVGILDVGGDLGRSLLHVPIGLLRDLLGAPDSAATQLAVLRVHGASREQLLEEVRTVAPASLEVRSWRAEIPELASFFQGDMMTMKFIIGVLVLVVALGMWNLVLMRVLARRREFGVLAAIGMRPRRILAVVVLETLMVATLGVLLGLALGAGITELLPQGIPIAPGDVGTLDMAGFAIPDRAPLEWYPAAVAYALISVWLLSILAGLPPGWKAARTDPTVVLQED